jgi:hypothetical protein
MEPNIVRLYAAKQSRYRPEQAQKVDRGIALPFRDLGARKGWVVSVTPRPLSTPGKNLVLILQEAGWVPGPVWTGAENLASTGIRSPDRPARSKSLYRLNYPDHTFVCRSGTKQRQENSYCSSFNHYIILSHQEIVVTLKKNL